VQWQVRHTWKSSSKLATGGMLSSGAFSRKVSPPSPHGLMTHEAPGEGGGVEATADMNCGTNASRGTKFSCRISSMWE
jgi:hypothetical protein